MTEQEAMKMIASVSEWLKDGAPGHTVKQCSETPAAELARDFCHELLDAANADGMSGCRLCQQ